jgi:hypothetical protein
MWLLSVYAEVWKDNHSMNVPRCLGNAGAEGREGRKTFSPRPTRQMTVGPLDCTRFDFFLSSAIIQNASQWGSGVAEFGDSWSIRPTPISPDFDCRDRVRRARRADQHLSETFGASKQIPPS